METPVHSPTFVVKQPDQVLPLIGAQQGPEGFTIGSYAQAVQQRGMLFGSVLAIPISLFAGGLLVCLTLNIALSNAGSDGLRVATVLPLLFGCVLVGIVGGGFVTYFVRRGLIARKLAPPTLTLRQWPLHLGASTDVIYRRTIRRQTEVQAMTATLTCTERVRYRVGTDTRIATHELWRYDLPPLTPVPSVEQIEARTTLQIPRELPPSFDTFNNQIIWSLNVTVQAPGMPDDTTPFTLLVRPDYIS